MIDLVHRKLQMDVLLPSISSGDGPMALPRRPRDVSTANPVSHNSMTSKVAFREHYEECLRALGYSPGAFPEQLLAGL
jgi:hypothetical protein